MFVSYRCFAAGVVGAEVPSGGSGGSDLLRAAVIAIGGVVEATKNAVDGASSVLELLHEGVFPERDVPRGLGPSAGAFDKGGDFLHDLVRDNTVSALETTFMDLMGHGMSIDYDAMVLSVPKYTLEQGLRAAELAHRLQKVLGGARSVAG